MTGDFQSFGRIRIARRRAIGPAAAQALLLDGSAGAGGILPFGNGRSYGDSCHNDGGLLAAMRGHAGILSFDPESGVLEAAAGTTLAEIIAHCAAHGWFLPVTPGTQHVTLGGAIANDVHGKNHHRRGSFGAHVESIALVRSDLGRLDCSKDANQGLFRATIGGMGLTGLIVSARIRMMKVASLDIAETVMPFSGLDAYFERAEEADAQHEYAVAWIDQMARAGRAGQGVLLAGNHAANGNLDGAARRPRLAVPFQPPVTVLNRPFLALFNKVYRAAQVRKAGRDNITGWRSYFYPLDAVGHWNRLYGPRGLFQHQSLVPVDAARETIPRLLRATHEAGQGSFLTVLKRFGAMAPAGLLSFARPGYTLTLDFPNRGAATLALLGELDRITLGAGGAVNPYKDARMAPETFAASFPNWENLEAWRDPAFMSDFWRRTALRLGEHGQAKEAAE
ncbi:MAG: FAD-binding oxidoreductase [Zhengella sp.]|uniref:FAD-binding oxidoreductase n=1 Tax=Zhengella sp. TaxID=2282762 RepID=UPI00352876C2